MSTKIEWTDCVWNPVTGCSHTSPGCLHCYAERMDRRQMMPGRKDGFRPWTAQNAEYNVRLHPERLEQPLHWRKPRRVFVNSMSDLFHGQVPLAFMVQVFSVMACAYWHTFQVLTKRPHEMHRFLTEWAAGGRYIWESCQALKMPRGLDKPDPGWPLPNVHLGVSAEDQKTFDERVKRLLQTPAAVRFVSLEPLLGPIILDDVGGGGHTALTTEIDHPEDTKLDWVIVGGESGPGARPMNPDWVRSIRDQCQAAGVPFFFKQWGEYGPTATGNAPYRIVSLKSGQHGFDSKQRPRMFESFGSAVMRRVGKKAAGRKLDGRTWDEFPEVVR